MVSVALAVCGQGAAPGMEQASTACLAQPPPPPPPDTHTPPLPRAGTGKTKTILGLLSIVLHSAPKGAFAAAPRPSSAAGNSTAGGSEAAGQPDRGVGGTGAEAHPAALDGHELWLASSPWLAGRPDPRWAGGSRILHADRWFTERCSGSSQLLTTALFAALFLASQASL